MTRPAKGVIYSRFSARPTEDVEKQLRAERPEELRDSISKQLDRCREWCQQHDIETASDREFFDEAMSGAEEDRPGLWNAIDALKPGMVLVVYSLDRLARDKYLFAMIEREVEKKRARIASVTGEGTDNNSAESELIRTIMQALAVYQRRITKARTKAAMLRHQAKGRRMSAAYGRPFGHDRCLCTPYGWRPDPNDSGRLIEDVAEQAVIRQIRVLREGGKKLSEITRELDRLQVPCRGTKWHSQMVKRILARAT